jgi:hypothetical protein
MQTPYYGPQSFPPSGPPSVLTWFRIYAGALAAVYLIIAVFGFGLAWFAWANPDISTSTRDATEMLILGAVYGVMGVLLAPVFAVGVFLPSKPWAWVYGIVLIAIGCTSCACLPATIPMLIHWLKPETKVYFGRTP